MNTPSCGGGRCSAAYAERRDAEGMQSRSRRSPYRNLRPAQRPRGGTQSRQASELLVALPIRPVAISPPPCVNNSEGRAGRRRLFQLPSSTVVDSLKATAKGARAGADIRKPPGQNMRPSGRSAPPHPNWASGQAAASASQPWWMRWKPSAGERARQHPLEQCRIKALHAGDTRFPRRAGISGIYLLLKMPRRAATNR